MRKTAGIILVIIVLAVLGVAVFPRGTGLQGEAAETPKAYYLDEIADTAQKVRALTKEPALVFFLCSDIHYNTVKTDDRLKLDSVTDMTVNMAALKKQIRADGLICLGDIVDAKPPLKTEDTKRQVEYVMKRLQGVGLPLLYCMGNHDDNRYISRKEMSTGSGLEPLWKSPDRKWTVTPLGVNTQGRNSMSASSLILASIILLGLSPRILLPYFFVSRSSRVSASCSFESLNTSRLLNRFPVFAS